MKTQLYFTALFAAFLMFFSLQSQAQKIFDDKLYLTQSGFYESGDVIPLAQESLGLFPSRNILIPITLAEAKKLDLPRAVKTSDRPLVLKTQWQLLSVHLCCGFVATTAKLAWWDRNEDGKVQPRRELRCVCKAGEVCKIEVTKVTCR